MRDCAACHPVYWVPLGSVNVLRLSEYLQKSVGVTFLRQTAVTAVETGINGDGLTPAVITGTGLRIRAEAVIVCPGDDLTTLFPGARCRPY